MDAFHTLAADQLIEAVADNREFIPFTWAICRSFNALILLAGASIILIGKRKDHRGDLGFLLLVSVFFGFAAYVIIQICALSSSLPTTMYQEDPLLGLITRPYDVAPLLMFLIAGLWVFPRLHREHPTVFSHALIISTIPGIVTQLHMAFGSGALYDHHFNIAHFLKIMAYLVLFCGITWTLARRNVDRAQPEHVDGEVVATSTRHSFEAKGRRAVAFLTTLLCIGLIGFFWYVTRLQAELV